MKDLFKKAGAWIRKHRSVCILLVILPVTTICVLVMIETDRDYVRTASNIQKIKGNLLNYYREHNEFPRRITQLGLPESDLKSGWGKEMEYSAEGKIAVLTVEYGDGQSGVAINAEDVCADKPQIKIIDGEGKNPFQAVRKIEVVEHGKLVMSIEQSLLVTAFVYFSDSRPERIVFYDIWGKQVAECTIRNGKPFSGTVWHLSWGLNGLKQSCIVTYQEGNLISTEPYAEEEVSALLKQLGELYLKHAPDLPATSK